jgi:N-acetylglucosamine kinase-like BadF-type ATPase
MRIECFAATLQGAAEKCVENSGTPHARQESSWSVAARRRFVLPFSELAVLCAPAPQPQLRLLRILDYSFLMRCVLGFDGGGTKTDCVLMDETGAILARSRSGPSNPMNVGTEASVASLLEAVSAALRIAGKSESDVASICGGVAGAGEPKVRSAVQYGLKPRFPKAMITITSDLVFTLAAAGESPCVVVIAGTGSAALGRTLPLTLARAGGFGPVIGDPGSAYDIGRRAVATCLQRYLNKEEFRLGIEIVETLGCKLGELMELAQTQPTIVFPKVFPVLAGAAEKGDEWARELLISAAKGLHDLASEVIDQLHLREVNFFLAKTGGVFSGSMLLNDEFDGLVRGTAPRARIGTLPRSVAEAAAQFACDALKHPIKFDEN